jgi:hypothetical protein
VQKGGRLIMKSAHMKIQSTRTSHFDVTAIQSFGETALYSSQIVLSQPGFIYIEIEREGHVKLVDSVIGKSSIFGETKVKLYPIYVVGKGKISSSNSSVLVGNEGSCAFGHGEALNVIKWSKNTPGFNSAILDEGQYTAPALTASQTVLSQYRSDVAERQKARLQIAGGYNCIT